MEQKIDPQPNAISEVMFKKHHHSFLLTTGLTLLIAGSLCTAGYYADIYFETKPILLIISIVIGFPITQSIIYVVMRKYALKKLNSYKNGKQ